MGTSEGTHATRDSRLLPQPGFPVVPLRDQPPISSGQTLKRPLLSTPDHQQTPDLPPPVLSGGGDRRPHPLAPGPASTPPAFSIKQPEPCFRNVNQVTSLPNHKPSSVFPSYLKKTQSPLALLPHLRVGSLSPWASQPPRPCAYSRPLSCCLTWAARSPCSR